MSPYLIDNPPARAQYRTPRRAEPTGAIVVHTAESMMDVDGPDGGAEAVARFIQRRTDGPGSYHDVADSDSWVQLVPYDAEAFGEGTGGNRWALHLSFACRATDWASMPFDRVAAMLDNGAEAAADMAAWVQAQRGITVPAERITWTQYVAGRPGFIGHGQIDPTRRHDPGDGFPWDRFLRRFRESMNTPTQEAPPMADTPAHQIQRMLNANGVQPPLAVDGVIGPRTAQALDEVLRWLNQVADKPGVEQGLLAKYQAQIGEAARLISEAAELQRRAAEVLKP